MAKQADRVAYFELPADDVSRASAFYNTVFGWETPPMGGGGVFALTTPGDARGNPIEPGGINGDISPRSQGLDRPLLMILVDDLNTHLQAIRDAGGKVITPRLDVAEFGLAWAVFADTEGNHVGVTRLERNSPDFYSDGKRYIWCLHAGHSVSMSKSNMKTTNLPNTFISVAADCPAFMAEVPPVREPKTIPQIEYELLIDNPYKYTSDDVLYAANGERRGIAREDFFARVQPDFRLSPLTKRYGWGVHIDAEGRIALCALGSVEYEMFASDTRLRQLKGNRSKRWQ